MRHMVTLLSLGSFRRKTLTHADRQPYQEDTSRADYPRRASIRKTFHYFTSTVSGLIRTDLDSACSLELEERPE